MYKCVCACVCIICMCMYIHIYNNYLYIHSESCISCHLCIQPPGHCGHFLSVPWIFPIDLSIKNSFCSGQLSTAVAVSTAVSRVASRHDYSRAGSSDQTFFFFTLVATSFIWLNFLAIAPKVKVILQKFDIFLNCIKIQEFRFLMLLTNY